jgi:DNA-binding IclR family transcriptional regulator
MEAREKQSDAVRHESSSVWRMDGSKPRIQSVGRALGLLNAIAQSPRGLTAQELSQATGVGRATTYHLLQSLAAMGYVVVGFERRYRVGLGVTPLLGAFERQVMPEDLLPRARSLASRTGETAYVAARQDVNLVLLCTVPGHHQVAVAPSPIGPIDEGHARGSGKLLLAFAPEDARERYLAAHPLVRITRRTITDRDRLLAEFERIRELGYAIDEEEYNEGVCCLAAPLGGPAAPHALVLSAPKQRFMEHRDEYVRELLAAAAM